MFSRFTGTQMERKFVPGVIPNPIILDLGNLNEIWDF